MTMLKLPEVDVSPYWSVTETLKVYVPTSAACGVPVIKPVLVFNVRLPEAGREPTKVYVVVPNAPVAAALAEYAVPTVAPPSDEGNVMVGPVTVIVCADDVAVKALGVPESCMVKTMLL
jgi:hypothetical protein